MGIKDYVKTNWINDKTKLNADNLNHIEDGIENATNEIKNLDNKIIQLEEFAGIKKITLNGIEGSLDQDIWENLQLKPESYSFYLTQEDLMLSYAKNNTDGINIQFAYTYNDVEYLKEYYLVVINGNWHLEIIENTLPNKVDKIEGKELSTNDFTDQYKDELDALPDKLDKDLVTNIDTEVSGDNININIKYVNLNNNNEQNITKPLPPVTNTTPGLMTSEDLNALNTLKLKVENLEGKTTRLLYTESTNPTKEEINNFVIGLGYTSPFEGIAVVITQTYHIWHYYSNDNIGWKDDGQDTVSAFTNDIAGIIKGSGETEGKVYAESDGTGSVYGWDALTTKINNHIDNTNNPHEVTKAQVGLENVENKALDNKVTENSTNYIQSGAVFDAINNGDLVHDTRKIAGHNLKTDITAEQIYNALELGTAAKKNIGNSADELPIIGSDGKLPLSIIPEIPEVVDNKQLVTEVTELGIPTKNKPYIVVKDEEVYRRNALYDYTNPIYPPQNTTDYKYYFIIKISSSYIIVWTKNNNDFSFDCTGSASQYVDSVSQPWSSASLDAKIIFSNSYYSSSYSNIDDAVAGLKGTTTPTYYDGGSSYSFTYESESKSGSGTGYSSANLYASCPMVKSNINSISYISSASITQSGMGSTSSPSISYSTATVEAVEGTVVSGVNSYKKLADKEYVDNLVGNINTILDTINGEKI